MLDMTGKVREHDGEITAGARQQQQAPSDASVRGK
jgi:hypothetical protein